MITTKFNDNSDSKPKVKKVVFSEVISIKNLNDGFSLLHSGAAPGVDGVKKTEFKKKEIIMLHESLKAHQYKPKPNKKVIISKLNGRTRQLAISSTRDKVVQAALYLKLKEVFEPEFSKDSYGYRPNLGCHDALNALKYQWQHCTWVITFDVEECFKTVNHNLLMKFLEPYCDQSVLELIGKILKVKLVYIGNITDRLDDNSIGIPQGSILSPLFCNVYMNKLDWWVKSLQQVWNKGVSRQYNPDYNKVEFTFSELELIKEYPGIKRKLVREKLNKKILEGKNPRRLPEDPKFSRLYYIRYADDFIVGFVGSKKNAQEVINSIKGFIEKELKFSLSEEKTKLKHGSEKGIFFLGVYLRWTNYNKFTKTKDSDGYKQIQARAINNAILHAPVRKLLDRAVARGFGKIRKSGIPRATSHRKWTGFEDKLIVNLFSSILRGIYNYYTCVNSRSDLWPVFSFYRKSCALTLADKHKLRSAAKAFKKYGPRLIVRNKLKGVDETKLFYPDSLKTNIIFKRGKLDRNLKEIDTNIEKIQGSYKINLPTSTICQYPGCHSKENLEEHHINPQSNIKAATPFLKALKAKNRETITLCRKHHLLVHNKKGLGSINLLYI